MIENIEILAGEPEFIEVTTADMVGQPEVIADQTPYADEEDT